MLNRTETPPGTCGLPYRALTWQLTCLFFFGRLGLRGGCDRPPVPFMGVPQWPVNTQRQTHAQPGGDSTRYLRATLSCTDLDTALVRGKCASSACSRLPGPLLLGCMPHGA